MCMIGLKSSVSSEKSEEPASASNHQYLFLEDFLVAPICVGAVDNKVARLLGAVVKRELALAERLVVGEAAVVRVLVKRELALAVALAAAPLPLVACACGGVRVHAKAVLGVHGPAARSEEHTSELQSPI